GRDEGPGSAVVPERIEVANRAGQELTAGGVEGADLHRAARPRPGDQVGLAVAVDVGGADADAAGEAGVEGVEAGPNLVVGLLKDLDVGPAAGAGSGDDFRLAVPVGIAGTDIDAAREGLIIGEEAVQDIAVGTAENLDVRAAAGAGRGNDV